MKENQKTVTKKSLIDFVSKDKKVNSHDARQIFYAFLEKIVESLRKGDRLEFRDFGVFEVVERKQKSRKFIEWFFVDRKKSKKGEFLDYHSRSTNRQIHVW